jgi:hypothetical protein
VIDGAALTRRSRRNFHQIGGVAAEDRDALTLPSFLACSSDPSCARISPGVRRIGIKSRNNRKFLPLAIIVFPSLVKTRLKVISLTDIFSDWIFSPRGWPSFALSDQSLPRGLP